MASKELREALDHFFIKDGHISEGFKHISVLLQMMRDLQFNLGIGRDGWVALNLDDNQEGVKKNMLPLLTPILLFSSSVDLLGRVKIRRVTKSGENGKVFKKVLEEYFDFNPVESKVFWDFRNSLTHQYAIPKSIALYRAGSENIIEKVTNVENLWFIYVNSMYTSLKRAKVKVYEETIALDENEQAEIVQFIKEHGLIKQQVRTESKKRG